MSPSGGSSGSSGGITGLIVARSNCSAGDCTKGFRLRCVGVAVLRIDRAIPRARARGAKTGAHPRTAIPVAPGRPMSSRYSCAIKTICRKVGNCVFVLNFPTLASRLWFSPARHSKFYNGGFPTIRSRWQTQKRDHPRRGGCRGHAHRISTSTGFVPAASADRLGRGTDVAKNPLVP